MADGELVVEGRKKRVGTFPAGDAHPRRKLQVEPLPEPEEEVGDGASPVLKDMRWAYLNLGRNCPGTKQQRVFREECRKDPMKFTAELEKREREFRVSKAAAAVAVRAQEAEVSGPGPSAESGVVVRLIDGLLAEIGGDG